MKASKASPLSYSIDVARMRVSLFFLLTVLKRESNRRKCAHAKFILHNSMTNSNFSMRGAFARILYRSSVSCCWHIKREFYYYTRELLKKIFIYNTYGWRSVMALARVVFTREKRWNFYIYVVYYTYWRAQIQDATKKSQRRRRRTTSLSSPPSSSWQISSRNV